MPSPSESPASNAARIVPLDCTSYDLALLLRLIENGGDRSYQWSELTRVLAVGARYQFQHIASFVRQPASHRIDGGNVKEIFNFAGSHGFHDLAKLAIAGFVNSSSMWNAEYDDLPLSLFKGIPGEYGAALIRAMAKHQPVAGLTEVVRWQRISGAFDVTK